MLLLLVVGGELELDQTLVGKIAQFNMWNIAMTEEQIKSATCGSVGNVSSWDTLSERGVACRSEMNFPGCQGNNKI